MNLLENQKFNNGINLFIGLGGVILSILGVYLTIDANKKYDAAYNTEMRLYHLSLDATVKKILLSGPSGGLPEFKSWTYSKQKQVLEQTLDDLRSQLDNIILIKKLECNGVWNDFIDYLILEINFKNGDNFVESEYYYRLDLIYQNCK